MTIEISPVQSQKLALAQAVGTVSLVLRNPANLASGPITTVHVSDLRAGSVASAPAHAARRIIHVSRRASSVPAKTSIEVVRGVERSTYQIARSE